MTACAHTQRLIPLFYDGELDGLLRREVSDHVMGCTACTHVLTALDRGQELLRQAIDEQVVEIDFDGFWEEVEKRLSIPELSLSERLRLWWISWQALWSWRTPLWATVTATLLVGAALLLSQLTGEQRPQSIRLADNDQAQIESLSASDTVLVWNEPTSNATVIWVSDGGEGGLP
ncbi:MAG: zf-HC2 domain-containing protein [Candidatus Binatia bacterium]